MRIALVALAATLLWARSAHADGVADEADLQFSLGTDAYAKGDFTNALVHFLASNRLAPNRNVMFNIARTYEKLDRFSDAYRYYTDAGRGDPDGKLKGDIAGALARIAPRVAVITVESVPQGATIYLERTDLGSVGTTPSQLGLKGGSYKLIAELAGYEQAVIEPVQATVGEVKLVKFELVRILGRVELSGPKGSLVRIDDERGPVACVLPCALDLPPGSHVAHFERPGFNVAPQSFTITAKQTARINTSSTAVVGSLLVSADEPNALIEVDGAALGFTPAVIPNVPVGKRKVRVSLRGYRPIERDIEVRANAQADLRDLVLTPERSVSAASREVESTEDAPASITVITNQELEAFGYPTILEALRGVRGFAVNFDSVYGNAAVRGLGQANDFSNRLLVLSDGAVLNENVLYQPFIHYDGRVDLGDVERIEVVRGPSSVLYGTGAVSGVVNLVLKGRDEPSGYHGQLSSYDNSTARARAGFTERLGRDAGVWASVAGAASQGRDVKLLFDDGSGEATPHETGGFDKFHAYSVTAKGWWKDVTVQMFGTARENTVPTGNYSSRFGDTTSFADDQRFLAEAKLERKIGKHELLLRTHLNYAYYHLDYQYDVDPAPPPGELATYNYFETYKSWWGGAEARATFALGKKLKLAFGGEGVLHSKVSLRNGEFNPEKTMAATSLEVDAPYYVLAASGLLDWRPSPKLRFQVGARVDLWKLDGNQLATDPQEKESRSFNALSPRLAAIIKPTDNDVIKLLGGSAFRAPSAYEQFYNDGGVTQVVSTACGERLESERIYALEGEYTRRFNRDWIGLVAGYTTLALNGIETGVANAMGCQDQGNPDAIYYRNSSVDQHVYGVDLEVRREFRAGTMVSAHYGYAHARYAAPVSDSGDTSAAAARLPNAPTSYAGFKFVFPIVQNTVTGAVRASLEDRRRIDTSTVERSERAVVADAVLSGLIARHGLRYAAGIYNLFNWQYSLPAIPYASSLMPQNGRSLIVSLTLFR